MNLFCVLILNDEEMNSWVQLGDRSFISISMKHEDNWAQDFP